MANAAALLLLLIAASAAASAFAHTTVTTTTMITSEQCKREIQGMSSWQCVMWIASEPYDCKRDAFLRSAAANRRYSVEEHLQGCCQQLKSLSPDCRCDAIWEMMMEVTGYGDIACALSDECGLGCSMSCPSGSRRRSPELA